MKQIIAVNELSFLVEMIHSSGKTLVLTGGCFDILHPGHLNLLQQAKSQGDILLVLLESDKKITQLKGKDRPIHSQQERAAMIAGFRFVDYVLLLPYFATNNQYDSLIAQIHPHIIATTTNDSAIQHKQRQANTIGAKVIEVTKYIPHKSTTRLLSVLSQEQ